MLSLIRNYRALKRAGVMGMNRRNGDVIERNNDRRFYKLVDDKLESKRLAEAAGISVPELYGAISMQHQIRDLPVMLAGRQDFVVKPVNGSGGNGVLVIDGVRNGRYRKASGVLMSDDAFYHHVSNILSGMYSLGGHPDAAMFEYRVQISPLFEHVSYRGVPDIRTVVYRGYPVMAMVRLPTLASDGKANLHQGAVGAGVNITTGETLGGVLHDGVVDEHPDTGQTIRGICIPDWESLLVLAARCYDISHLGYLGVDFVLDKTHGPMMLEMNARPGLNVQIANGAGLLPRLQRIEPLSAEPRDAHQRVALARELFSSR